MKHTHSAIFLGSAGFGLLIGLAHDADAITRRIDSAACFVDNDHWDNTEPGHTGIVGDASEIWCPVPDDSYLFKADIATLDVYGIDLSTDGEVNARACVTYLPLPGGECGTTAATSASGTGEYVLNPSLSSWKGDYAGAYGYILVKLPKSPSGSMSYGTFRGFRVRT